jgi:hypothetical protein
MILAAGCIFLSGTALAQTTLSTALTAAPTPKVRIIEWDLPAEADLSPGAMVVDSQGDDQNRIWFVTRVGGPPHVYRMDFPKSFMKFDARWTRWALSDVALFTGGLRRIRPSRDRRFIVARTDTTLERIDTKKCTVSTQTCERTVWTDQPDNLTSGATGGVTVGDLSDVAVDDWNNIFTSHTPPGFPDKSYVQKLTPGANGAPPTVTRWIVGGGAGLCTGSGADPCLAGIDIHPYNGNLVYYSEEGSNSVAELNTSPNSNKVRRWSLGFLKDKCNCGDVFGPRQLHIDRGGKVWLVTGSGHVVSLDPSTSRMTAHQMPADAGSDPFGVAPDDDVIGYTNSGANRVGMMIPRGQAFPVPFSPPTPVDTAHPDVPVSDPQQADFFSSTVTPMGKTVMGNTPPPDPDGTTFVEALINVGIDPPANDSTAPLGISPAKAKSQGTFFYAVGLNGHEGFNRVGFVRLPVKGRIKNPRDDDDRDDGCNCEDHWHDWHGHATKGDDDDDGIPNEQDSPTARENVARGDATPLAAGATAVQSMVASPTTLALIAIAEADNPTAQIGIDVFNSMGLLMASSVPALGVAVAQVALPSAGTYTWRVRNYGSAPINYTPTSIVREPDLIPDVAP